MKRTPLIAAACTIVATGALWNTADAAQSFGPRAQHVAKPTKSTQAKDDDRAKVVHRAGPRSTIVMPTRKIEDDTLVAASGAKEK